MTCKDTICALITGSGSFYQRYKDWLQREPDCGDAQWLCDQGIDTSDKLAAFLDLDGNGTGPVVCEIPICNLIIKNVEGGGGVGDGGDGGGTGGLTGYKLVWSDEFNGTSIDTSKWCHEFDCQSINNGIEYLDGQGHLVLDAKSGQPEPLIRSKGESSFGPYGIMDIRAKFSDGVGSNKKCINNQIWMASDGWTYEVDIATNPASKPKMLHSTIMNRVDGTQHWDGGVNKEFNFDILNTWHTYRFEWTNTYCKFYVENNGIFYEIYTQTNQFYVPNVAMNLKMALCIGPCDFSWACDGSNPQATPLLIDYVRFYQKI